MTFSRRKKQESTISTRMSLTINSELNRRLDEYSAESLIPKSRIINRAIDLYLSRVEENKKNLKSSISDCSNIV